MSHQIKGYADALGVTDKFNMTVTIASVNILNHFILKSETGSFSKLIEEFPKLKTNFKDLLEKHYGFNVFTSKEAKSHYLEPDLLPFN